MRGKMIIGVSLLIIGIILFIFDFMRLGSILLYILAIFAFISPILSGKKIASYLHDSNLAKEKGFRANPASLIYLWLFFWLFFILIYTVATFILSETIKFFISTMKADYLGLIYTLLLFLGSLYIFKGIYEGKGEFLTLWGKTLERSKKAGKNLMQDTMERAKSIEKYL